MLFGMTSQAQERIPPVTLKWRLQMALDMGGIEVGDMATQLDVSRSTVSRWLNGRGAAPKRPFLIQWAMLTGVDLAWLEHGQGDAGGPGPDGGPSIDPDPNGTDALARLTQSKRSKARHAGGRSTRQYPQVAVAA